MGSVVAIHPGSVPWSNKIRRRAKNLAKAIDTGYLEMAEILWAVYDTPVDNDPNKGPVFHSWGYASFGEYAEIELGLSKRRAERLRQIWMHYEVRLKGRLDRRLKQRLYALGWSKVREIATIVTPENAEKWLELAEKSTYVALQQESRKFRARVEELRKLKEGGQDVPEDFLDEENLLNQVNVDPDDIKYKTKVFALAPDMQDNVEAALERASQLSHSKSSSRNLSLICMDFLATNDFKKSDDSENALRYLNRLEQNLNLKIIATDPDTGEVVYGMMTLEKLAKS